MMKQDVTRRCVAVEQPAQQENQQEWQQVQDRRGVTYLSAGSGRPILFLHGVAGGARHFTAQLRHFGQPRGSAWRAVAWDMPGYGGSVPLPLVTIEALTAALAGFIGALGLERPVLVGHSLGGMLVQRLLADAPGIAAAVVLSQTSAAFGGGDPAWAESFLRDRLGPLDEGRGMAALAPDLVAGMLGDAPDPEGVLIAEQCAAHTPDPTYRDSIQAMPGFDLRHALPRIGVPTLVVAGSLDRYAPPSGLQRLAARVPGARCVVLDGVGHLAHLEQPARFNAALEDFLETLPS